MTLCGTYTTLLWLCSFFPPPIILIDLTFDTDYSVTKQYCLITCDDPWKVVEGKGERSPRTSLSTKHMPRGNYPHSRVHVTLG